MKRVDWVEPRRPPRRIEGRQKGQHQAHYDDGGDFAGINLRRQLREEVNLGGKKFRPGEGLDPLSDGFDIFREGEAQDESGEGTKDADTGAGQEKHPHDHAPGRAHGSEDGNVPPLVFYQHNET